MTQSPTDKLIQDGLAPIKHRDGAYGGNVWQSENPCAVYANALKVAVDTLKTIYYADAGDSPQTTEAAKQALADINRIAGGEDAGN